MNECMYIYTLKKMQSVLMILEEEWSNQVFHNTS